METIIALLLNLWFWISVFVACVVWYAGACWIARGSFDRGNDPVTAAKNGAFLSIPISVVLVGGTTWVLWTDLLLTIVVAAFVSALTLAITILLIRQEPTGQI